ICALRSRRAGPLLYALVHKMPALTAGALPDNQAWSGLQIDPRPHDSAKCDVELSGTALSGTPHQLPVTSTKGTTMGVNSYSPIRKASLGRMTSSLRGAAA